MRRILLAFALLVSVISCSAALAPSLDRVDVAHAAASDATGSHDSLPTIENAPPALETIAHESRALGVARAPMRQPQMKS